MPDRRCVALVTTVHDPDGRLAPLLRRCGSGLGAYDSVEASVTDTTDAATLTLLRDLGVRVAIVPPGAAGDGQRQALRAGLEGGHSDCFVCDLDRWLHWSMSHHDELTGLPERLRRDHADAWYICLGRTARAMRTHPVTQAFPETMTNRALSNVAGRALDATAGAAWIRQPAARLIVEGSSELSKATDLEWPGLVLRADANRLAGLLLEGLEFETPDGYPAEIAASGSLEAWISATYDPPRMVRERLQLAADSVAALIRVTSQSG